MNKYISFLMLAATMTACSNDNDPIATEYGNISLAIGSETEVIVNSRAATTLPPEDAANYYITIKKDGSIKLPPTKYGALTTDKLAYPAESGYTVTAESYNPANVDFGNDDWGEVRFAGTSNPITIIAHQDNPVTIPCKMCNAKVSVSFDQTFVSSFTNYSVEVYEPSTVARTLTFDNTTAADKVAYFNIDSDPEITYTVKGQFSGTNEVKILTSSTTTLTASKWVKLNVKANENGKVTLSITVDDSVIETPIDVPINPYE